MTVSENLPIVPMAATPKALPNCTRCAHYFITFDARFPYGCRAMNFKSKQLPQHEVRDATGTGCLAFRARPTTRERDG